MQDFLMENRSNQTNKSFFKKSESDFTECAKLDHHKSKYSNAYYC